MEAREGHFEEECPQTESAREWLERLESVADEPPLTPEDWESWEAFAADDQKLATFNWLAEVRELMHKARPRAWPTRAELLADKPDEQGWGYTAAKCGEQAMSRSWSPSVYRRSLHWALAATVVLLPLLVLSLLFRLHAVGARLATEPRFVAAWSTATGEHRMVTLPDGSAITLGARTTISLAFTGTAREIELTSGEALFQVAHDKSRAFRVRAGGGTVTALGTAFNISRTAQHVLVTVSEGSVFITPSAPIRSASGLRTDAGRIATWTPVRVEHGEQVRYQTEGRSASAVTKADSQSETAWSHGTLVYTRRPLIEVIDDVRRYTDAEITVAGDIGHLPPYSGTVSERNVRAWVHALPQIYSVEVRDHDGSHMTIRPRTESAEENK